MMVIFSKLTQLALDVNETWLILEKTEALRETILGKTFLVRLPSFLLRRILLVSACWCCSFIYSTHGNGNLGHLQNRFKERSDMSLPWSALFFPWQFTVIFCIQLNAMETIRLNAFLEPADFHIFPFSLLNRRGLRIVTTEIFTPWFCKIHVFSFMCKSEEFRFYCWKFQVYPILQWNQQIHVITLNCSEIFWPLWLALE